MNNIINYDLIQLIGAQTWSEEEQYQALNKFVIAMGGFLKSKFQNKLDNNSEKELKRLLSNPKAQEKDLIDFFKAKIPELPQFLEKYLIEYKMLFVISVYEAKIAELEKRLEETNDSLTANELSIWKNILELAKNDDWDEVIKLLQF